VNSFVTYQPSKDSGMSHSNQNHTFETRPGPGLEPGWVDKKIGKIMTRCDPTDPAGWPDDPGDPSKPDCNPLTFVFFFLN